MSVKKLKNETFVKLFIKIYNCIPYLINNFEK